MKIAMMRKEVNVILFVAKVLLTLGIKKCCPEYKNLIQFYQNLWKSIMQPNKIPAVITR